MGAEKFALPLILILEVSGCQPLQVATNDRIQTVLSQKEAERMPRDQLIAEIRKIPGFSDLQIAHLATDPMAPVIIILADQHGSPQIEAEKLQKLYTHLRISFVGLEGWAGHKADQKRGYDLLNAEEALIQQIRTDSRFHCVGLEDPEIQERALKLLLLDLYMTGYIAQEELKQLKERKNMTEMDLSIIKISEKIFQESTNKLLNFIAKLNIDVHTDSEYLPFIEKILLEVGINRAELYRKPNESGRDYLRRLRAIQLEMEPKVDILSSPIVIKKRNEIGARRMAEQMKAAKSRVGIMVFGVMHLPGLIKELLKLGDFTILHHG